MAASGRRCAIRRATSSASCVDPRTAGCPARFWRSGGPAGMSSKVTTMRDAVADLVRDGDTVAIDGYTHLICFAAAHDIIRQRQRELTHARKTHEVTSAQIFA